MVFTEIMAYEKRLINYANGNTLGKTLLGNF